MPPGDPMPPPMGMAGGGVVKMANEGQVPYSDPRGLIVQALEEGVPGSFLIQQNPIYADLINQLEAQLETKMGVDQYEAIKKAYIPYGQEFEPDPALAPPGTMEEVLVTAERLPPLDPQGQIKSRALPQADTVNTAATIDTRAENLLSNQPRVSDPQYLSEDAQAFRRALSKIGTTIAEAPGKLLDSYIDPTMMMDPRIAQKIEGSKGVAKGNVMVQGIRSLYPEIFDKPTTEPQVAVDKIATENITIDPKQGKATQVDSTKLNLDTATKSDGSLFNMALSEKSLTDYGYTDYFIDPDIQRQADEIIGDRTELKPKGTSDIQTQGIKYVSPKIPALVAPSFANMISEQERRLAKIREDAKRDVGAQALINLGAGIAEGDVSGGLVRAGEAAAKVRAAERAAESDIANLQTQIKMAEEQGRFDTAKALRADALKEAQFEATFGLKRGELAQTLQIAEARIEAEGNTEKGRALRARLTALNDLASRLQAQIATTGIKDPATDAALQQALSQLQSLLGVKVAGLKDPLQLGVSAEAG